MGFNSTVATRPSETYPDLRVLINLMNLEQLTDHGRHVFALLVWQPREDRGTNLKHAHTITLPYRVPVSVNT